MARQIVKLRRGTKEEWKQYENKKPEESMPLEGELVIEYENITDDKGAIIKRIPRLKIGDGVTPYSELPYISIDSFVMSKEASITLVNSNWKDPEESSGNRWYQEVEVKNAKITANSKVDLQLSSVQITSFLNKKLAFVTENHDGTVYVYCVGKKPDDTDPDYTIQVTVTEVLIDE